ncbi:BglG family transcription antiterminator [Paenibacillus crassostreae]|uniref:Sugar transporter n=1 Tax=Paenibacillus crassostreae TaxID=1763538 RepID=A0A162KXH5_9BACL|nr:BglG family transcription antiterminator [Paenibacillus crassostreae]AOZ92608.1 sugar transporter [Paenibacillus crassostreae]OAB75523.1 sugar transporter [Paenibacillus crassostreae]
MRKITARQRQMILLLLSVSKEITAAEIASDTGVSVRTVHREMEEIEQTMQDFGLHLSRKSGKGIQLGGPETDLEKLRLFLYEEKPAEYSGDDRKLYELCSLLEAEEPVKLFSIAHTLKVTVASVSYDLDELEPWVRKFGLQLLRRRGYGVEIIGGEVDKRRAICRLAAEHLDQSDLVGHTPQTKGNPVFNMLLNAVGKNDLIDIENTLWDMEWKWTAELPEIVYTELLLGLSVTARRIAMGRTITTTEEAGYSRMSDHRNVAGSEHFVQQLSMTLDLDFPRSEILYIAGLFDRVQDSFSSASFAYGDIELMELVYKLTESVVRRTGIPFQRDRSLREGLLEHIEPALNRIREGTRIRNPLLGAIRKDYEYLFHIIQAAVEDMNISITIPDEEIGFLVMHFGASEERLSQLRRNVRAILVCASGLSSSRLLATRLAKEMPQIEVLGNISWYEAARLPEEDYDLIISTIELPLTKDRYIKISPLLTGEESEKLLNYIQNTTLRENKVFSSREPDTSGREITSLDRMKSYKYILDEIVSLLERFRFYPLDNIDMSIHATLSGMLDMLKGSGVIDNPDILLERLMERERMASQVIPDTRLALFHTRSSHVHMSSLTLYRLSQPVHLEKGTEVKVILLMLAPRKLSKESLEVLSEISALLLNSELVRLLEESTETEIRRYLSTELLHFFENKI